MKVGNLGKLITFIVDDSTVRTFQNFERTVSGRWAVHNVIKKKPIPEFIGPDLSKQSMVIILDAAYGVNPRKVIEEIEKTVNKGIPRKFVIGGKQTGKNKVRIVEASEAWDKIIMNGKLVFAKVTLQIEEYR